MSNTSVPSRIVRPGTLWLLLAGVVLLGSPGVPAARAQGAAPAGDLAQIRAQAEKGDLESLNVMGNAYTNALLGVKQDFGEALAWYRRAADKGFAPAQFNLGLAYELGRGVPVDERQSFKYYLMAAEQGFAAAQFNVGNMYSVGRGVSQDLFEANLWYKQAAEKGVVEAQFNLGLAYEAGRGVKKDEVQAVRWYKQAADRGFPRAQYNLGLLLEDGRGVTKNEAVAAQFYRAAAVQGFAAAQNNLGLMISEGRGGLPKDPAQAYFWLSLAAANGSNPAARDFVGKSLSNEQLAAAKQLLEDRKAGKPFPGTVAAAPTAPRPEPAPLTPVSASGNSGTARVAELTAALEKATQANTQFAETNQRLELEKARLEQQLGSPAAQPENAKLIEQLREQSRRLAGQVQSLTVDKETAERDAKILAAHVKDLQEELARAKAEPAPVAAAPAVDGAKFQTQITALTAKLAQATADLAKAQQAQQELAEVNTRLQQEKATLAAAPKPAAGSGGDNPKYPVPEADKEFIIANLQRDNARLNDEVKRSTRELMMLNVQLRNLRNAGGPAAKPAGDSLAVDEVTELTAKAERAAQETARLQADNARLTARVTELEQPPRPATPDNALAPKLAEAQQAAARLQQQVQALQTEKIDQEKRAKALEQTIGEKNATAETAVTELAGLRAKLSQAEQQLAAVQKTAAGSGALQAQVDRLAQQNARLERQLADAATAAVTQRQATQKLTAENTTLARQVRQAEEALAAQAAAKPAADATGPLRKKLAEAEAALEKKGATVTELTAANDRLARQLAEATAAFGTQQQAAQKLTTENAALARQVRQAEEALAAKAAAKPAVDETGPLRQQLAELQGRLEQVAREQQALTDKAAAEHNNYLAAQARVATLEDDLRNAQQKPAPVDTTALDDLKKQLAEANAALEKSGATVAELTAINDRLAKQAAAADSDRHELAAAKSQVADLRQQLSAAKQPPAEIAVLREENDRLRPAAAEAATLKAKAEQLARDNDQLAGLMTGSRRDLNQAQARVAELEKQLEEARTIRTRSSDDSAKLRADLADANQGLEKLNTTVAELTAANDRLEKDLDNARKSTAAALAAQSQAVSAAQPDAYKMEISTLQARVKALEGQIEDERGNAAKEVATMAAQLARTRDTNKSLTEANRALMNAKESETPTVDKDEFDRLQARARELATAGEETRRLNEKLADENQRLATERETLAQQLADARKAATVLPGLNDEKAALQERLEAVGAQLLKAQQDVDTLQKENADATSQALASRQAAEKAQAELAALQGRTTEAEKAAETQNTSVAELTAANTKLEGERTDLRRQLAALRAENSRLSQTTGSLEQLKADAERSAQQNIDSLTAQLAQTRSDLQSARDANSRLVEGNVSQERERSATLAQLQQQNAALAARLTQAQGTLDQIASAARLGTPAAALAAGNPAPAPTVNTPPAGAVVRYHTVTEGDSLSRISMRYYGTANRWQEIYNANRDVLQGSSTLRVGMQLRIP